MAAAGRAALDRIRDAPLARFADPTWCCSCAPGSVTNFPWAGEGQLVGSDVAMAK